jgi:hypothetical protein
MKRPAGVTLLGIAIVATAAMLTIFCVGAFFVAIMAVTGEVSNDPVSAAITGMAIGGAFSLLIMAGVIASLAAAVFRLQEWAWSASIATIVLATAVTLVSLFAFHRYFMIPEGLSVICHLLVMAMAGAMLAYLLRPGVRQAFTASNV